MKEKIRLAVLGCTGSIGKQTLSVVDLHPELFEVTALTVHSSAEALLALGKKYRAKMLGLAEAQRAGTLLDGCGVEVVLGKECNTEAAVRDDVDMVVVGLSGMEAIFPLRAAMVAGKRIALANKESIVCGGSLLQEELEQRRSQIFPVDSEHSAVFQCIQGLKSRDEVDRIILTASGGPFRNYTKEQMQSVTVEEALAHPVWSMGPLVTVGSSTLANKGLEVIEAHYLYGVAADHIDVLIHPGSIVHSFVQTVDGALLAQLGVPDMRLPIQYALTHPARIFSPVRPLKASEFAKLEFFEPDLGRFPALGLAYEALRLGGTATAVFNGANEAAVELFLQRRIGYMDIARSIEGALGKVRPVQPRDYEDVLEADRQARAAVRELEKRGR